jgi:hypothetical protein
MPKDDFYAPLEHATIFQLGMMLTKLLISASLTAGVCAPFWFPYIKSRSKSWTENDRRNPEFDGR